MKKNLFYTLLFFSLSALALVARAKMRHLPVVNEKQGNNDNRESGAACNFPLSYFNDNI